MKSTYPVKSIEKRKRIDFLIDELYKNMPEIEADRAVLLTESYRQTEELPIILRRALALKHILDNIPITIRDMELVVGSATKAPRGCQTFPEYSYEWLEAEFDTVADRSADPFYISDETKNRLREVHPYWKNKTNSDLATSFMAPEARRAMELNFFTTGNYFYNGIGHVCVKYDKVLQVGINGILREVVEERSKLSVADGDYATRNAFLEAVIISLEAVKNYAARYSKLAKEMAAAESDSARREELLKISANCAKVPAEGASSFMEACQSFWFIQMLLQMESSGHSISPGRFDQYMYPYYKNDIDKGLITVEDAQEYLDCIWVKLNDLNKCRDAVSAEGFAGYSLFQNMIVGGQDIEGTDATNELSFQCLEAAMHVKLPQPSLSMRVWNGTPHELMIKAAELTRIGTGLPAYYNDEVIIPALMNRGVTLQDARDYCIIGCVEPQKAGKTDGWHDAAFFNMCRPLELVFDNGVVNGEQIGLATGDVTKMQSFEEFYNAYKEQMKHMIKLLVNSDNAIDSAHAVRCPLPFLSSLVDDCIEKGKSVQEGGAHYNFTGPQGFGIANMADSLYAVKTLVFEQKKITMAELSAAMKANFGEGIDTAEAETITKTIVGELAKQSGNVSKEKVSEIFTKVMQEGRHCTEQEAKRYKEIREMLIEVPKYGNDIPEVDAFARDVAYTYTRPLETHRNPRGGQYQAGLYPVSANVPLGRHTGATPDGRLAGTPIADGVSPSAGKDKNGPTAAANSVSALDHLIASNGTLLNMKFHPSALEGRAGLESFAALIRGYFDRKGSHMQFNVVSRETLLDAQKNPEKYKSLVVRVAGYSALFTTLSKSLQDDIIRRTELGFSK